LKYTKEISMSAEKAFNNGAGKMHETVAVIKAIGHGARVIQRPEPNIVEEVAAFIRRFVFFQDDVLYEFVAAWIIATYLTQRFEYVGYLFAYSPEPGSGKSRLLEVLDLLVNNSSGLLVSPTEAVLFRTAAGGTQLLDEVDSWRNRDELRSVLNAGFRFGGFVLRMREGENDFEAARFPVYGPRALAGIGTRILDATTRDRTFMLEMLRQTRNERREQLRTRKIKPNADNLKATITAWIAANEEKIGGVYDKSDFPYLADLGDRTIDITQPIATIIEIAYADGPRRQLARSKLTEAVALTREEERSANDQHKVLRQLWQIVDAEAPLVGSASELSVMFANLADPPSPDAISSTLRLYGFKTKSRRKNGQAAYRYELSKARLAELLERYGVEELPEPEPEGQEPPFPMAALPAPEAQDARPDV
jgi:hypothetical protein